MTKRVLQLGKDLTLPLDAVTRTFGILAVRGAGKSNTAAVIAEEMFAARLPFCVIDPVGSWYGLRSSADGRAPGLAIPIFGGKHGDVPLERGAGELIADLVIEKRLTCVLDLSRFESESAKKAFLLAFAQRLYAKNENPLHLFLEEADDYIPQKPMRDEAQLLRAWENIVRRGRARGLGMTLITQRSAAVAKMVLTQVETLFAMRTTGPQDIAAIEAWVKYHQVGKDVLSTLASLEDGEAWVWSPHYLKTMSRHQIRRRSTFDSGATPKNVHAKDTRPPATLADIDLASLQERMAATIEKAKADDPRELRKQVADLRRELAGIKTIPIGIQNIPAKRVEVLTDADRDRLDKLSLTIANAIGAHGDVAGVLIPQLGMQLGGVLEQFSKRLVADIDKRNAVVVDALESKGFQKILAKISALSPEPRAQKNAGQIVSTRTISTERYKNARGNPSVTRPPASTNGAGLAPAHQRILNGLAFLHGIGATPADKTQLALIVGVSPTSGGYFNNLGSLRSSGLIDYPSGGTVALTAAGAALASSEGVPSTTKELHDAIQRKLPPAKWKILEALIAAYPNAVSKDDLAAQIEVSPTSGGYFNNLGSLRSLGLVDYPQPGTVAAKPVLFLE